MKIPRLNWPLWAGFVLSVLAVLSYFFVFMWFPVTRDFPWVNLLLMAAAAVLLFIGIRRAFRPDRPRPKLSKVAGVVLTAISIAIFGLFIFAFFIFARQLPPSPGAPQVGQQAPEFTLSNTDGKPVALTELLASTDQKGRSPKGVLLIFYRGYW